MIRGAERQITSKKTAKNQGFILGVFCDMLYLFLKSGIPEKTTEFFEMSMRHFSPALPAGTIRYIPFRTVGFTKWSI